MPFPGNYVSYGRFPACDALTVPVGSSPYRAPFMSVLVFFASIFAQGEQDVSREGYRNNCGFTEQFR
jgi:hypothetical protein